MFDFRSTPAVTVDLTLPAKFANTPSLLGVATSSKSINSITDVNSDNHLSYVSPPSRQGPVELLPIEDPKAVARAFGMSSTSSACPLPGHDGSARIEWVRRRGSDELRVVCVGCHDEEARATWAFQHDGPARVSHWLTSEFDRSLADAYWAIRLDRTLRHGQRLTRGKRWLWQLLLRHDLGLVTRVPVELAVPPDAPDDVVRVAGLFALLRGLRLAVGDDGPMPFTDRFVAEMLFDDNRDYAAKTIKALVDSAVIVKAGEAPPLGGVRSRLVPLRTGRSRRSRRLRQPPASRRRSGPILP
jgi:hypothetical protein